MLVRAHGFAVRRGIAERLLVELDVRIGLPSFAVVGLAGAGARDTRERVQAAILNIGLTFPRKRVTVNVAPASQRRLGAELDLAIACCVLAVEGHLDAARLARLGLFAELGLGGTLRPCPGVAAAAATADDAGLRGLIVARADLREARAAATLPVAGPSELGEVVELLGRPIATTGPRRGSAAAVARSRTPSDSPRAPAGSAAPSVPLRAPAGSSASPPASRQSPPRPQPDVRRGPGRSEWSWGP
jgi:magnesium chelatase family protein